MKGVLTITKRSGLGKCERASTEWEGGAKHEACNLVSDKEIMIECLGSTCGKNLSGSELVVWEVGRSRRCKMFVVQ